MGFVHLHCRSGYSLFEGTASPQALVAAARKHHMSALAITDHGTLYGAVHFYLQAQKAGIKPLIGMEAEMDDGSILVLLARNMDGYRNLCHLSSVLRLNAEPETFPPAGFDDEDEEIPPWDRGIWGVPTFGFTNKPPKRSPNGKTHIAINAPAPNNPKSKIQNPKLARGLLLSGRHVRGLVALSGGQRGLVNRLVAQGKIQQAARAAGMLLSAFGEGNFFIEITPHDERHRAAIPALAELANELGIPLVATNDVLYVEPEDARVAEALASRKGAGVGGRGAGNYELRITNYEPKGSNGLQPLDSRSPTPGEAYFRSPEEMAELFKDYPQAIANASYIAEQCNLELPVHRPKFPQVTLQEGENAFSRLWKLCFAGAGRLYKPLTEAVIARLQHELQIIEQLGFSPYFLVVHDISRFTRKQNIPTMARGSAANSLVAYVLGITQVDPLAHELLFERFLNPSRAEFELPDIDLDLCWRRRDEVLHYIYRTYGEDHVATVGTHITFRPRSAWREMAKAMAVSPERINYVSRRLELVDNESEEDEYEEGVGDRGSGAGGTVTDSQTPTPSLLTDTERTALELAKAIEGLPRHAGMHCAGVVITPEPITDIAPLQRASRDPSMAITQYEKDAVEALGLVKMDLLGSRALTTLVDAVQSSGLANTQRDIHRALAQIPFDDERTYRMLAQADTLGCFQLESPGMRGLLKWLRPHSLSDITNAISLFRPGPLEGGFLEMFMRRHLRQEPVSYHHPSMEPILKDTYGVILYQEQFLKLAHILAGVSLGEAEKLRKELSKSHTPDERARLGSWFVAGAIERGIDQMQAEKVWEIIAGYSGFGFCKAHACSYALTAYRSAYMKANYPAHYMAAQINNAGGYYGTSVYLEDARRWGVEILPPHVNYSSAMCEVQRLDHSHREAIRIGLQFVKSLSERTVSMMITERRANGPFLSLLDLMARVEMTPAEVTALVKSGACDDCGLRIADCGLGEADEADEADDEPSYSTLAYKARHLNRRQMMWLLPSLITTRRPRSLMRNPQSAIPRAERGAQSHGPLQVVMGDLLPGNMVAPRILGSTTFHLEVPDMEDYTPAEKLALEEEALGFAASHNVMELYEEELVEQGVVLARDLPRHAEQQATVAGVAAALRSHIAKDGNKMLFLTLQDTTGLIEVVLFPDAYKEHVALLANGGYGPYAITGHVQVTGKGRGIGVQPPANLRPADAVALKMHPVIVAERIELICKTDD